MAGEVQTNEASLWDNHIHYVKQHLKPGGGVCSSNSRRDYVDGAAGVQRSQPAVTRGVDTIWSEFTINSRVELKQQHLGEGQCCDMFQLWGN